MLNFYSMDWGGIWSLTWSSAQSIATLLWLGPAPFLAILPRWLRIGSSTTTRSLPIRCGASKYGGAGDHVFVPFAMEDGGTLGAHGVLLTLVNAIPA